MKNKDTFVAARIGSFLQGPLNEVTKKKELTISKIIRNGIFRYLLFFQRDEMKDNPMLVISKNELAFLLARLNEKELEQFAELMYKNGIITRKYHGRLIYNLKSEIELTARTQMSILTRIVFSKEGQRWFREFHYNFHKNRLTIAGRHDLNKNFSIFFKFYIVKYFKEFQYALMKQRLDEEKVMLILQRHK
ncbi:MAG: hypothetical protein BAJALOKI1v1_860007 [Promethearchaeota archaeon]|nr:MAG: hypothetical protein BAJALOKI1v1_860007 [Candidatus Lokiarchaeota archaeon]